ncbi:hypothetical protein JW960_21820 [candidate division KSB1 bacterium]|nr:hypothetical protein [candidate division KSB1 bacterium]
MAILLIFVDGIGIGVHDPEHNPCTNSQLQLFNSFIDRPRTKPIPFNGQIKAIDAILDVPGIPQSATGQTSLLTGENAQQMLGRHLSGFPNEKLRQVIAEKSLLRRFTDAGKKAAFLNAYHPLVFEIGPEQLIRRLSVTSVAVWTAGLQYKSFDELRDEQAVFHDFTNRDLIEKGYEVPQWTPFRAGEVLATCATHYDFCMYEYFKTDRAGHNQNFQSAVDIILDLEQFILTAVSEIDLQENTVLVTSDHGNFEDLSIKSHTMNPVPLLVWGQYSENLIGKVNSIVDIAPLLITLECQ